MTTALTEHAPTLTKHAKRFANWRAWLRGALRAVLEGGCSGIFALAR